MLLFRCYLILGMLHQLSPFAKTYHSFPRRHFQHDLISYLKLKRFSSYVGIALLTITGGLDMALDLNYLLSRLVDDLWASELTISNFSPTDRWYVVWISNKWTKSKQKRTKPNTRRKECTIAENYQARVNKVNPGQQWGATLAIPTFLIGYKDVEDIGRLRSN
ncbi:hypothetical protein Tco_1406408 [Tanacetum coccineum]